MCMNILGTRVSVLSARLVPFEAREDPGLSENGVMGGCKQPYAFWELNLGLQTVLLTAEPSLQL